MRFCLIYDGLYPYTIGGADRWYRNLAEALAVLGHEVAVVTPRQWSLANQPQIPGVKLVTTRPQLRRYSNGRRRVMPSLLFGLEVLWHLARHRRNYDIVHTASFPYFPVLAAGLVRPMARYQLFVDWHEVWTRTYWQAYLGQAKGWLGWVLQGLCIRITHQAICFSRLHARRLREGDYRGPLVLLSGQNKGAGNAALVPNPSSTVIFVGRFIPEKRIASLVHAVSLVRQQIPDLRCELYGDGPVRDEIEKLIKARGLEAVVRVEGFVDEPTLNNAMRRALCLVLPSAREGYGLVVVEAMARGTPSIIVSGSDNATTELVVPGVNGAIAPSATAEALTKAILAVHESGASLRASTHDWFNRNSSSLSFDKSMNILLGLYCGAQARRLPDSKCLPSPSQDC